jgi:hypothetical protein
VVITIHDLDTPADLIAAIAAISQTANEHGDSFYQADWTFSHTPPPAVPTVEEVTDIVQYDLTDYALLTAPAADPTDEAVTGQQPLPLPDGDWQQPGPVRYVPCPHAGQHDRLTDCWLCWTDHHRKAGLL